MASSSGYDVFQEEDVFLIDTGSAWTITRNDKKAVNKFGAGVRLKGVSSATTVGKKVDLKRNNFDVKKGLFLKELPVNGIMAVFDLTDSNHDVMWFAGKRRGIVYNVVTGRVTEMIIEKGLSGIRVQFYEDGDGSGSSPVLVDAVLGQKDPLGGALIFLNMQNDEGFKVHVNSAHMLCPPGFHRTKCPDCNVAMGRRGSHAKIRPLRYKVEKPLELIAGDYFGPIKPESIRRRTVVFIAIDDESKAVWPSTLAAKSQIPDVATKLIQNLRTKYGKTLTDRSEGSSVLGVMM